MDIAREPIPTGFGVILCRHVLFHNTNDAVRAILESAQSGGARWFVATTMRGIFDSLPSPPSVVRNPTSRCVHQAAVMETRRLTSRACAINRS